MLVERLLVVDRYAVTEHDGIGYLHHGRLEVQGEQHAVLLRLFDLLGVELAQGGHVHHRGIDDLALQQRQPLLHDGGLAVGGNELDLHLTRLLDRGGVLARVEVLVAHVDDARLGPGFRPLLHHLVRVLLGELLHRNGRSAVGVALTKYGIDRRAENHGEPLLQSLFGLVLGLFGVVGDVVSLFLQLLDRGLQLRNGSADVGQLDDVGFGSLCELSELRQMIGDLLIVGELLGEVRDDPAHERDVSQSRPRCRYPRCTSESRGARRMSPTPALHRSSSRLSLRWSSFVLHVCRSADHGSAGRAGLSGAGCQRCRDASGAILDSGYFLICNTEAGGPGRTSAADLREIVIVTGADAPAQQGRDRDQTLRFALLTAACPPPRAAWLADLAPL